MILQLNFGRTIGVHHVDLPNVSERDYAAIKKIFVPAVNNPKLKSRDVIAQGFQFALQQCPSENPSDIWHHVIYRLYIKHKQGPDPAQSWVRTSGEGFELMIANAYNPLLAKHHIRLRPLISGNEKKRILDRMGLTERVGSSKIDIAIEKKAAGKGVEQDGYGVLGGLHVKVSLAERVSDDIPASRIMMAEGFLSILSTLDVKSFPPPHGDLVNRGELGSPQAPSDKRAYIESHGDFSACISYNSRTVPSPATTASGKKIYLGNLRGVPDSFTEILLSET